MRSFRFSFLVADESYDGDVLENDLVLVIASVENNLYIEEIDVTIEDDSKVSFVVTSLILTREEVEGILITALYTKSKTSFILW